MDGEGVGIDVEEAILEVSADPSGVKLRIEWGTCVADTAGK